MARVAVPLLVLGLVGCGVTERVSVDATGGDASGGSSSPAISAGGRYTAFVSDAPDLVSQDGNGAQDVFVRDRRTGSVERVSVDSSGSDPNAASSTPAISADGRYVSFSSAASDIVAGDEADRDVFVRDRVANTTKLVSAVAASDASVNLENALSADGRFVAFSVSTVIDPRFGITSTDIFLYDRTTATVVEQVTDSQGQAGGAGMPTISGDGRFVGFVTRSLQSTLEVEVKDRVTGEIETITVDEAGGDPNGESASPAISADGRFVAFRSLASDLVTGDTNAEADVFVRDRETDTTQRVSVGPGAVQSNGSSGSPSISADGRFVAFGSVATNLVAGDMNGTSDVFVHDRRLKVTRRESVAGVEGGEAHGISGEPSITADGQRVAFSSSAPDLVRGDGNGLADIFVRSRPGGSETAAAARR